MPIASSKTKHIFTKRNLAITKSFLIADNNAYEVQVIRLLFFVNGKDYLHIYRLSKVQVRKAICDVSFSERTLLWRISFTIS